MSRVARLWLFIAFGLFAAPLAAQQAAPDQSMPPQQQTTTPPQATQTCPDGSVIPADASCPAPPPFPPMPSRAPHHRWVDVGSGRPHAHHHATVRHHAARRHSVAARRHRQPIHVSKRTIRWCHHLSHRQMMRRDKCKALIAGHRQAVSHRHRAVHRHVRPHRHHARHRRT